MSRKMEEASKKLKKILDKAEKKLHWEAILSLSSAKQLCASRKTYNWRAVSVFIAGLLASGFGLAVYYPEGITKILFLWRGYNIYDEKCTIETPDWLQRACRPPEDCTICNGVTQVDRISNVSPDTFEELYAYSGRPVVVTDATQNWTAPETFSFDFLKTIYEESPQPGCQFFPYKTEFRTLSEVFNMSRERASMQGKPWYVGWSNCDDNVAQVLRQHYSRPYFLPRYSETKRLDWLFIGSRGYGAHMHVDNVGHASWQAQLSGQKLWTLQPPPECLYQCQTLQVTVNAGEIFVLDTNRWYHQTHIVSDEISITIGAEYD